jgi:N-sulfoglucosamine sulfohydrolase
MHSGMARHRLVLVLSFGFVLLAWAQLGQAAAADNKSSRPNILWLVAEDMSPDFACYGAKHVNTPTFDKLSASGVRFTRAFTTAPVCSPSRSAFMTGMYQTTIGAHNHRSHRDDNFQLPDGVQVFTLYLEQAGYFTANIVNLPARLGFRGTGKTDWNFTPPARPFMAKDWSELKTHQPFFAQINFQETHRTFHAPKQVDPSTIDVPPVYPDHPITRKDWAEYLDAVMELDRKVGLILQLLEDEGLAENTIVIVMSDHGQPHVRGKQFCYDDGLRIPLLMRWARNFPAPREVQPGRVDERLVEAIDLAPTFLDIAGVTKPAKMQGRILVGERKEPAREYAFGARDRCDETVFRFRTARDLQFRYIKNFTPERPYLQANAYKERQYPVWTLIPQLDREGKLPPWHKAFYMAPTMPAEELYDVNADPWAMTNLVASPREDHQAALTRMRAALSRWIEDSNDQGKELEKVIPPPTKRKKL